MTPQVLITGASSDIGMAVCRQYLAYGYRVLGLYNNGQPDFSRMVEEHPELTAHSLNFESAENTENFIREKQDLILASEVMVHAAALVEPIPLLEMTAENLLRAYTVNVIPSLLFIKTLVPAMIDRGWGRIVNLGSIGVKYGGGNKTFCYSLSKHALEFFPKDHKVWAASNVLINTLRVGVTDTRMHKVDPDKDMNERVAMIPMGRMATPEEIADVVYWLGSKQNKIMTGQVVTAASGE